MLLVRFIYFIVYCLSPTSQHHSTQYRFKQRFGYNHPGCDHLHAARNNSYGDLPIMFQTISYKNKNKIKRIKFKKRKKKKEKKKNEKSKKKKL